MYLPSGSVAAVSPAFDAAWNITSSATRRIALTATSGTPLANNSCGIAVSNGDNCLAAQFVSAPLLGDQEISGTIKGQVGAREFTTALDAMAQLVVRVVSNDGSTVRGTLLSAQAEALSSEWATAASHVNRKFPLAALSPAALSTVNALDGDRLVFEIGAKVGAATGSATTLRFQDDQASDLPEDETTASGSANPWLELSGDLVFVEEGGDDLPRNRFNLGLGVGL